MIVSWSYCLSVCKHGAALSTQRSTEEKERLLYCIITLHYNGPLYCIASLHFITLHYITLHYITLHCIITLHHCIPITLIHIFSNSQLKYMLLNASRGLSFTIKKGFHTQTQGPKTMLALLAALAGSDELLQAVSNVVKNNFLSYFLAGRKFTAYIIDPI